jgi:lantibiotic biosynthesis protein
MTHDHHAPARIDASFASANGASWRALLSGSARDRALETVDRLADTIAASCGDGGENDDPSLSGGSAGLAVFFAQLAREGRGEEAATHAARCLDHAVDALATRPLGASLYAGFTGIAWAADVVDRLLGLGGEDRSEAIDAALVHLLAKADLEEAPYDIIYGLTGLGVYALERWPRPAAMDAVARLAAHLELRARHDDAGAYWWTAPELLLGPRRQEHPGGGVDVGVAHGMAGVLPFLARARSLGAGPESVEPLVEAAVRWLLAHAVPGETGPTVPFFLADDTPPGPARSAWCYGDPGVATALLVAARDAHEPFWSADATALGLRAARRPAHLTGVIDAGFCHGSAGLAHLFNRMYQLTGRAELADAALFWLERTLGLCAPGTPEPLPWADSRAHPAWNGAGLLEGAAGVALVLLAASTPAEPEWDRMFLASRLAPDKP